MTRIVIPRGSAASSSSSDQNRSSAFVPVPSPSSEASPEQQLTSIAQVVPAVESDSLFEERKEEIVVDEISEDFGDLGSKGHGKNNEELSPGSLNSDNHEREKNEDGEKVLNDDGMGSEDSVDSVSGLTEVAVDIDSIIGMGSEDSLNSVSVLTEVAVDIDSIIGSVFQEIIVSSHPPSPSVLPPTPSLLSFSSKGSESDNAEQIGSSRRPVGWPGVSSISSPTGSRPSSPQSQCECEGYNSADEQRPCFSSFIDDADRDHRFEIDLKLNKGLDVKKMLGDGNCLFRAVADQVFGDSEQYKLVRQMCIDYIEENRDHFSDFITEDFTAYCKRKRMDKVYGNYTEIQALSEIFNRPIHIYSYSSEPINIFHSSYNTDMPPIRLSYHHGNHYNSLVDPHQPTIGAGFGFNCLQGNNVDTDQVTAAMEAHQDQQIDYALLAVVRRESDFEYTEKEIERMVIEASRAEYLAGDCRGSSTCVAEPSSTATDRTSSDSKKEENEGSVVSSSMQKILSMGFSYMQVAEAYSIFGDDMDAMVDYLIETSSKGKAPLI